MKIFTNKIAGEKIEIVDYLSNDIFIFKFNSLSPKVKEEGWNFYQKEMNHYYDHSKKSLENEIQFKRYNKIGTRDELIKINLNHVFESEFYITNGQQIVSVLKSELYIRFYS